MNDTLFHEKVIMDFHVINTAALKTMRNGVEL